MNYCYLSEKLGKTPEEIRNLFALPEADYYDHEKNMFSYSNGHTTIRIVYRCENELDTISEDLADTYWDEYTNQMTQLSWKALSDYLLMRHEVVGIKHAAFLIDIAERNCIRIGEALREEIVKHAVKDRMIDSGFAMMKNFHRTTFWDTVHKPILKILNVGFYKDAFVRV